MKSLAKSICLALSSGQTQGRYSPSRLKLELKSNHSRASSVLELFKGDGFQVHNPGFWEPGAEKAEGLNS